MREIGCDHIIMSSAGSRRKRLACFTLLISACISLSLLSIGISVTMKKTKDDYDDNNNNDQSRKRHKFLVVVPPPPSQQQQQTQNTSLAYYDTTVMTKTTTNVDDDDDVTTVVNPTQPPLLVAAGIKMMVTVTTTSAENLQQEEEEELKQPTVLVVGIDSPPPTTTASTTTATSSSSRKLPLSLRFPSFGTYEFETECPWTTNNRRHASAIINNNNKNNCTFLVRPLKDEYEGISHWMAKIVEGHLYSTLAGCRLLIDYGPDIELDKVLMIHPPTTTNNSSLNWTVPWNYDCHLDSRCFMAKPRHITPLDEQLRRFFQQIGGSNNNNLPAIPHYRFAYHDTIPSSHTIYRNDYIQLVTTLSLNLETTMACSLTSLFQLNPRTITLYAEPDLYTRILPTLVPAAPPDSTLIMSLYIRTGQTDVKNAKREEEEEETKNETLQVEDTVSQQQQQQQQQDEEQQPSHATQRIIDCALDLEHTQPDASRIVWMVVTDSPFLKTWITKSYDTTTMTTTTTSSSRSNSSSSSSSSVRRRRQRKIVTTRSRGVHTRASRRPSTQDFAEALVDWYLIGETDLVITDDRAPSFGCTAALRTARPLYKAHSCSQAVLIHSTRNE